MENLFSTVEFKLMKTFSVTGNSTLVNVLYIVATLLHLFDVFLNSVFLDLGYFFFEVFFIFMNILLPKVKKTKLNATTFHLS